MPVAANWNGDTLVVFDVEQAKVSSYTNAGVAGPDVAIAPEFISPVSASGQIDYVAVRSDRAVLLKYPLQSIATAADSAVQVVLAQRPGPYAPDTISTARVRSIARGGHSVIPQPGSPEPRTAVGPDGWFATSAADGTYRILVVNPEGDPVHQICRDVDPLPLTAAELGRSAPPGFEEPVAAVESAAPLSRIGSVGRLVVGSTGELWVDRQRPAPFTTEGLFGVPGSTMDVYDATGTYIGDVQVPPGVSIQATAGSLAVGLMFSEFDEPWVIEYRVHLPAR
jgi:hypothetical protein